MVYRFGDCTLDTQRHRLQRAGQPVRLRAKAFQVLCYLLERRDRTVLKSELYEQVWPQQFISEATLESTLRAVRQAIGDSGRAQQLIQTVYGYGYRFIAAVEEIADLPAEIEDKAPGMPSDAVAAYPQDASDVVPLPPAQGPAVEPDGREGGGGKDQEGVPPPGNLLQPGEWKLVTVLCAAPVTGSAGGAQQDADTWYRQLSRLYTLAQPVVQRYGGTLQPVLGDHVLAVFGAPVAQEDHAQRAVLAALELQRRVREVGIDGRAQQGDALGLRVGLHTGQVAVGRIGGAPAGLAAVVGETVMRALALQAQAVPGTILCSDATAHLVQGMVRVAAVAPVPMAGKPTPVAAYTVLGLHRRRPFCALALRVWAPFVGRHHELAILRTLLTQVEEGRGQVVGMIGEPGVGKSRLCYEFLCASLAYPWVILETQGTAYGQATPYLPIVDLLKDYFRLDDRDDLPMLREKVTAKLRRLDDALTPTTPAFLTLLDVPVEDPPWQALEAPQRRQRTLDALKRILLRESQVQPLLLVVENLHWIDAETQAVLDTLVESLPAARLLLLTTYRPEYRHEWGSKTYYMQLRLDPLPRERARELVDALLGDAAALEPLKQRLVERTQGNPFFLEESIRTLVETQVLVGGHGAFHLAKTLQSIQVPSTVQAVLAARIDRLPPGEKRLLPTAAVIGTEVPFPLLQAVAELPEEGLRTGLAHLQGAEFLYETSLFPELTYTFKHALTHEVAYGSLLQGRRWALHARIVEALEALAGERVAEQVERLAHHALRGEVWDKAVAYCRQAGEKAYNRGAFREAVTGYEQAIDALGHLPEHSDTGVVAIAVHRGLGSVVSALGEYQRSLALLGEAEARARQLDDRAQLGRVLSITSWVRRIQGDLSGAMTASREALEIAATLRDAAPQADASHRLGQAYASLGDFGRAAELLGGTWRRWIGACLGQWVICQSSHRRGWRGC